MNDIFHSPYHHLLQGLTKCMQSDLNRVASGDLPLTLPVIPVDDVYSICHKAKDLIKDEPNVVHLTYPLTVVGDLHGHYLDLIRILQTYGLPVGRPYLFLGDFVDRGEFSLETIILIFLLKIMFSKNVTLIRGNHEFETLCYSGGFYSEIERTYHTNAPFYAFLDTFSVLPFAAIINKDILCIHGGIGPSMSSIQQIADLKRPLNDFGDDVIDSMLWSDPMAEIKRYEPSRRGSGFYFGQEAVDDFLLKTKMKKIIRAHECMPEGIDYMFDNRVITVFSASNYCGTVNNRSAVIVFKRDGTMNAKVYEPLPYLKRHFTQWVDENGDIVNPTRSSPTKAAPKKKSVVGASCSVSKFPTLLNQPTVTSPVGAPGSHSRLQLSKQKQKSQKSICASTSFIGKRSSKKFE